MKYLALLFLLGYASASFHDELDDVAYEADLEETRFLKGYLDLEDAFYDEGDDDEKIQIVTTLKGKLNEILEKMKDAFDKREEIKQEWENKAKEMVDKLKEIAEQSGKRVREHIEKVKSKLHDLKEKVTGKVRGLMDTLLQKLGLARRATVGDLHKRLLPFDKMEIMRKLKDLIKEKFNKETRNEHIEKIRDFIINRLNTSSILSKIMLDKLTKGLDKLKEFLDILFPGDETEERSARSLKELKEKIKQLFKDLHLEFKEKYEKFGEWLKQIFDTGKEKLKDKMANIKAIASELIAHAKDLSKETAQQTLEFMEQYKDDLGELWVKCKQALLEVVNKKDD